jgi:tetratricopeptide (TPR) repeat protein
MSSDLRIRRDRSVLSNGSLFGRRRRGIGGFKVGLWLLAMGFMGLVVWQFNNIQPKVLAVFGSSATATPPAIVYAQAADRAFWRGDLDGAIVNYREAAKQNPKNVDILYELSRMLIYHSYSDRRNAPDVKEALEWATKAVEANPNNYRAQTIYCFALLTDDQTEQAVRACIRAIDLNSRDADAHAYLSSAYAFSTRMDTALQMGERAVGLNDKSIDAHRSYAAALLYKGRYDLALEQYKAAVNINPRLEFPYFELAYFAINRNKYEIAIEAYNRVLSMNSRSVKAYTRLCETYYRMGETTLAMDNCSTALTLDDKYTAAHKWYGQVLYTRRDYEDAIEQFKTCQEQESAENIDPDNRFVECYYLHGLALFLLGDCDNAFPIFTDILSWTHDPNAIRQTNIGINKCNTAYQGLYKTPTPIPPTPTKPPPIQ